MIPEHLAHRFHPLQPVPTGLAPVLPAQIEIEAVLFDVYGTLFISGSGDISLAQSAGRDDEALAALLFKYHIESPPDLFREQFFAAIADSHTESRQKGKDYPEVEIDLIWHLVTGIGDLPSVRAFAVEYELLV